MLMRDHANALWGPTSARPIGRSLPGLLTIRKGRTKGSRTGRNRLPVETGIGRS